MPKNYAAVFQDRADKYLELAAKAVNPQDQMEWLNLARECLTLQRSIQDNPVAKVAGLTLPVPSCSSAQRTADDALTR
jgi:hypothetical protein